MPPEIGQLNQLTNFHFSDHQLSQLQPEVIAIGTKAILKYLLQQLKTGGETVYEAKLIIVGQPYTGKTTLVKKINNPNYPCPHLEDPTQGIDVKEWHFTQDNGKDFRVNIWDFGGQEIYKETHQFFLTKRSLYILVADSRQESPRLDYWMEILEKLSGDSPLLIIKNEIKDSPFQINTSKYRGRFRNLKEILSTNFANNRGLDKIVINIKHYICSLPHVGTKFPRNWTRVRATLEGLKKEKSKNYISLNEYIILCKKKGFKDQEDALQLSQFLHDIGIILHFQENKRSLLYQTVILNTEWGIDAVYKVLDNHIVKKNKGRFTGKDLDNIWNETKYQNKQGELLELMEKFKLCYTVPESNDSYIAPQLLNTDQPNFEWNNVNNLFLRYRYDFMPRGIITRFIVKMHRYIHEQNVWRSGVILKREDTLAQVAENEEMQEIQIRFVGSHMRDFRTIIIEKIDEINFAYKHLKVSKLIPCRCSACQKTQEPYFYEFDVLQKAKDKGFEIQCQRTFEMLNVDILIDDFMPKANKRNKIFISHSDKDIDYLKKLQVYLTPLRRQGLIEIWDDTNIQPGMKLQEEIIKGLTLPKIAILLVSSDFLASNDICEVELPTLLRAAEEDGALILSLIINHCKSIIPNEIAQYQCVNESLDQPLESLKPSDQDKLFDNLVTTIKEYLRIEI